MHQNSVDDMEETPSSSEMQEMMTQKAHELFKVCDTEEKGFITKRDMQRLQSELPLSPDQLEDVFDSLDDDKNGFLTLEEFTVGFGSFLGLKPSSTSEPKAGMASGVTYHDGDHDQHDEEQNFHQVMEQLGASSILEGDSTVKSLWCRLRKDDPDMASTLEDFVFRVSSEIRKSKSDFDTLEEALRMKTNAHDEELRKLSEEMETQIKQEKNKILSEEKLKERQLRENLEKELYEKDKQLQDLVNKHQEMEEKLGYLNTVEAETKVEREKLAKEKEELEESYFASQKRLSESQAYINQLREQQKSETRERARAALKLTEGIALERETLIQQLEKLKTMNRKLQDEKDEASLRRDLSYSNSNTSLSMDVEAENSTTENRKRGVLEREGSILGKYFDTGRTSKPYRNDSIKEDVTLERGGNSIDDDNIECDDDVYIDNQGPAFIHHSVNTTYHPDNQPRRSSPIISQKREVKRSNAADDIAHTDKRPVSPHQSNIADNYHNVTNQSETATPPAPSQSLGPYKRYLYSDNSYTSSEFSERSMNPGFDQVAMTTSAIASFARLNKSDSNLYTPDSPRTQPVGADLNDSGSQSMTEPAPLQRIFKVVFVGDSGVGKSSFIHRFCSNHFRSSFSATVGVDFQIKSIPLEGQLIVLQLWDTAGQERFCSITKQYFRKADGVIIMYDVTTEVTFTNIRNWMESVKEGASDDAILMLLGNKLDLAEDDQSKVVSMKNGTQLADEYGALFYETSALSGENVTECMEALARVLKDGEDKQMEKALQLADANQQKKSCCGK